MEKNKYFSDEQQCCSHCQKKLEGIAWLKVIYCKKYADFKLFCNDCFREAKKFKGVGEVANVIQEVIFSDIIPRNAYLTFLRWHGTKPGRYRGVWEAAKEHDPETKLHDHCKLAHRSDNMVMPEYEKNLELFEKREELLNYEIKDVDQCEAFLKDLGDPVIEHTKTKRIGENQQ